MRVLAQEQYQKEAEPLLRQIFITDRILDYGVFAPNVTARVLVYPSDGYVNSPLIDTVVIAAEKLGESGCYLSEVGIASSGGNKYLYIPLSEFSSLYIESGPQNLEAKFNSCLIPDHYIFSEQGKWAIRMTSASYGLLGSSPDFIESIRGIYPTVDLLVSDFLEDCRLEKECILKILGRNAYMINESWLPKILTPIYGSEVAAKMLKEKGLP